MAWGATAVAAAWGGPWAQWFLYPLPVPSRDVPPFGPGLRPASGPLGRLRDKALLPFLLGSMEKLFLPSVNAARDLVAQAPFASIDDVLTAAPLVLYMTAEPLEYPRSDWPQCVRMVGPCCWDPPADPPSWLAGIEQSIVLVSTSSEFQDDGRLVTTALEALADEDVHVVATLAAGDAELPRARVPGRPGRRPAPGTTREPRPPPRQDPRRDDQTPRRARRHGRLRCHRWCERRRSRRRGSPRRRQQVARASRLGGPTRGRNRTLDRKATTLPAAPQRSGDRHDRP